MYERQWKGRCGTSTIRDAVEGRGSELRTNQLRETLAIFLSGAESANQPTAESANVPVALSDESPEYGTIETWKRRAITAEAEVQKLRAALHALTAPERLLQKPVSSKHLSEAQRLALRASAHTESDPSE